jgi:thiaminase/transcriptional activator TenA
MFGTHHPRVAGKRSPGLFVLAVWLAFSCWQAQGAAFTDELWSEIRPLYANTLEHRFLKGLADGSLPRSRFQFYLVQDAHYLRTFAKTLSVLAAKSPREDWSITLNTHAISALQAERELHEGLLGSYGISAERAANTPIAPTTYAYMNHLLAVAYEKPFREGLAAVLPCYWIYWEVGKELQKAGSPAADYQRWIDQYASQEFGHAVEQVLAMMNAEAENLDARTREVLKELFQTSARYEWMFWDMAWREEKWPP